MAMGAANNKINKLYLSFEAHARSCLTCGKPDNKLTCSSGADLITKAREQLSSYLSDPESTPDKVLDFLADQTRSTSPTQTNFQTNNPPFTGTSRERRPARVIYLPGAEPSSARRSERREAAAQGTEARQKDPWETPEYWEARRRARQSDSGFANWLRYVATRTWDYLREYF